MKFFNNLKPFVFLRKKEANLGIEYTKFISKDDYEYIYEYLKNEPDCTPKRSVNLELDKQTKEILKIMGDNDEENYLLLEKMYDENNIVIMTLIGECLCFGKGCKRNLKRGLELIVKAAVKEHPNAQYLLGLLYNGKFLGTSDSFLVKNEFGRSLNDRYLSAFWKYRAAMNGHSYAQYLFAEECHHGKYDFGILNQDIFYLYSLSAEQGVFKAAVQILHILFNEQNGKNTFYNKELGIALANKYIHQFNDYSSISELEWILRKYKISL